MWLISVLWLWVVIYEVVHTKCCSAVCCVRSYPLEGVCELVMVQEDLETELAVDKSFQNKGRLMSKRS